MFSTVYPYSAQSWVLNFSSRRILIFTCLSISSSV
nr:MAG TPA: hypothetical protein [Caudoviricetes sp.]DAO05264.1 MAG TPA: hypothetical protein [Caudoviricetes sp.]